MSDIRFETVNVGSLRVHVCSTDKFKTNMMVAMVQQELSPQTVTLHALLPSVLQRGTQSYPSTIQLKQQLDALYGATLFGDVFKRGERHIMQLGLEVADDRYLKGTSALMEDGMKLLGEILYQPVMEDGAFRKSYVEAEKKNLKQKIESLLDDKIRFAAHRCVEEMCKDEPYALFNHGRLQDLDAISPQSLYTYYLELVEHCPIDLYFVGNVTTENVVELVKAHFRTGEGKRREIPVGRTHKTPEKVHEVVDRLDVNQGKLNLGYRTQITLADPDYPALQMYNGILGGFPHSKLFINVREKASLAYYAASRLESHKGILTVQSGIEIDNYQQAVDIIRKQFAMMERGEFTESEMNQTRAMLINQLKERQDRAYNVIDAHYHGVLSGQVQTLEQMIEGIHQVTDDEIKKVAQKIQLDTVYFLRNRKGGNENGED
ncbi:EF-P 5-aminopentanol modification-associated protein YfmF [Melghirimyces algeriensis]|uniref:Predicted Zn-dependent peptidase n=1 Tax=Melghirimyces algeriensis TaxID=910412 RepID=A0A521C817_9BACL|nr:pitrilysin family protein [Melghirimyces algeriensis]SMO55566.1 Predicted Zn-dependent peptidase [Melghirimyces algeriensis]